MSHDTPHPLSGQTVPILVKAAGLPVLMQFEVEDWADRVRPGAGWQFVYGRVVNPDDPHDVPLSRLVQASDLEVHHL